MKIDWFNFIIGIVWGIMGIIFFIKKVDLWMLVIAIIMSMIYILKSYFGNRMRIRR